MTVLLSVITTTYKPDLSYFEKCLRSLETAGHEAEIIVVNDDPESLYHQSLLTDSLLKHNNFKIIQNDKNLGMVSSYCRGFQHSQGKYVCLVDHDDVVDFSEVLPHLKKNVDIIYTNEYKFSSHDALEVYPFPKPNFDPVSALFYFYTHHVTLFRGDIVRRILSKKKCSYLSTFDLWINAMYLKEFRSAPTFLHIDSPSYGWRIHPESSASSLGRFHTNEDERISILKDFLEESSDVGEYAINPYFAAGVIAEFNSSRCLLGFDCADLESNWRRSLKQPYENDGVWSELTGYTSLVDYAEICSRATKIPINYALKMLSEPLLIIPPSSYHVFAAEKSYIRHIVGCPFVIRKSLKEIASFGMVGLYVGKTPLKKGHEFFNILVIK